MASFPISSPRGSLSGLSGDISPDSPPPKPPRLSRSEVATYWNIVQDLESNEEHDLAWKLSRPTRSAQSHSHIVTDPENGEGDIIENQDEDGMRIDEARQHRSISRPRRVDGLSFTPSYQDEHNSTFKNRDKGKNKRKRGSAQWDERDSTKWPLSINQLHSNSISKENNIDTLKDNIISFASSYIRLNNLLPPSKPTVPKNNDNDNNNQRKSSTSTNRNRNTKTNKSMNEDEIVDMDIEDGGLSDNLGQSTVEILNKTLISLAILRPAELGKNRKLMSTINWNGVLSASTLGSKDTYRYSLARKANKRLRDMYRVEERDVLKHRLDILQPTGTPSESLLESLYDSVLPKKSSAARPHQSKTELEKRAEKRRIKEKAKIPQVNEQTLNISLDNGEKRSSKRTKRT
ncbi:uncharacterized protein IL334_001874 [Kwoniella shivajii]|uniref:Rrn9 domain-containing protein n=1 Tax=Kwoniella shivajii TaxID=564305 RepID=A0ABZ1CUB9_9TREE|nr:hypothetical protein IL334_001874 [Kwoniella shivajii]